MLGTLKAPADAKEAAIFDNNEIKINKGVKLRLLEKEGHSVTEDSGGHTLDIIDRRIRRLAVGNIYSITTKANPF